MSYHLKKIAAFFTIYFIWGSTYLAIRIGLETIPPFLMAACRFAIAGTLLCVFALISGASWPTRSEFRTIVVVGCLLFFAANGLVSWGEQYVPSGIASVLIATVPFWMSLLDWGWFGGPRPSWAVVASILLGFTGVWILMAPFGDNGVAGHQVDTIGAVALLVAAVCWTSGSLISRHWAVPESLPLASGLQMFVATVPLTLTSWITGEWTRWSWSGTSERSLWAFGYLVVFGAAIAFLAYLWLLRNSSPSMLATYAFINPLVAVALGWWILHETVTPRLAGATALIVAAVIVLQASRALRARTTSVAQQL